MNRQYKQLTLQLLSEIYSLCKGRDSNSHGRAHYPLKVIPAALQRFAGIYIVALSVAKSAVVKPYFALHN